MKPREPSPLAAYAIFGAAGVQLAASTVAGLAVGNYLDTKWGWLPWLTIAGLILGFAGGLLNLVRILKWSGRQR